MYLQTPYSEVMEELQQLGFEPGWGDTVGRTMDTMNLALNLLEAPDSVRLQEFLSRTPNMFNVVILSPHGFFGQKDVLGKPDTGGQVGRDSSSFGYVFFFFSIQWMSRRQIWSMWFCARMTQAAR